MTRYVSNSRSLALVEAYYNARGISTLAFLRRHCKLWGYDLRTAVARLARSIRQEQRRYVYCDSCGCNVTDADCSCFTGS